MATPPNPSSPSISQSSPRGAKVVSSGSSGTIDAIELLKGDHRQVEGWFADFAASDDLYDRVELAESICEALTVHAQIEEEIFYPAFLDAVGDENLYDEALEEHDAAADVIAEIDALLDIGVGTDEDLGAKIKQLAEMIQQHVRQEEQPGGMFSQANESGMDMEELGAQIERRKLELMDDQRTDDGYDEAVRQSDS